MTKTLVALNPVTYLLFQRQVTKESEISLVGLPFAMSLFSRSFRHSDSSMIQCRSFVSSISLCHLNAGLTTWLFIVVFLFGTWCKVTGVSTMMIHSNATQLHTAWVKITT